MKQAKTPRKNILIESAPLRQPQGNANPVFRGKDQAIGNSDATALARFFLPHHDVQDFARHVDDSLDFLAG